MMVGRLQARRRSNPAPKTASTGIQLRNRTATRVPEPVEEEEECDVVIGCMKKIMLERYEADLQHAEENNKLWAQQRKLVEMDDAEREEAFRERLAQEQLHLNPHAAPVSSSTQKKTAQGNEGQVPSSRRASKEGRKRAGAPARPMEVHTGPAQSSVDGGNCDGGHQNDSLMKDAPPQPLKRKLEDDEGSMLGAKRERTGETSSAGGRPDGRQARGGVPDTGETSFPEPLLVDCMIEGSPSVSQVDLGKLGNVEDLWRELGRVFKDNDVIDQSMSRLVYQDEDGEWLLLVNDQPWGSFIGSVTCLMVTADS